MSEKSEAVKAATIALIDQTNAMNGEDEMIKGMVEGLQSSHRTLQQSFMRVFAKAMEEYADSRTDQRNESAVDFAERITKLEHHFPFV